MEKIEIGFKNGPKLDIKKSIPTGVKCRVLPYATSYHIKVAKGEYIIFQHLQIGPYSCWYTQYLLRSPKQLYCKMHSDDVEFHSLLQGGAMYILTPDNKWFLTSEGTYNIIVNPPHYTVTSFTNPPMATFDIHIKPSHFKTIAKSFPIFKDLYKQLLLGKTSTFFPQQQISDLNFRLKVNKFLRQMSSISNRLKGNEARYEKQLDDIIASFALSSEEREKGYSIKPEMIDKVMDVKEFISKEYLNNKAVTAAQKKFAISPSLLNKYFKIMYNMKPREFLHREKVDAIKRFIQANPQANLTEISMAAGFLDTKHVNDKFKELEGITIKQYRQKNIPNETSSKIKE